MGAAGRGAPERPPLHLDAATFWGNLVFLQTILVPTYGTNALLWSLANEFWYYMLFPLLAVLIHGWYSGIRRRWRC